MADVTESLQIDDIESGFSNLIGYRLVEWDHGLAVLELTIAPQHLNRGGVLHGGVLTTMIDTVGGYAGNYCVAPGHVRKGVTLALTTTFVGQASSGLIRAVGRRRGGGRKIYISTMEVTNEGGDLIAIGEATYRYRSGSESIYGVPV